MGYQCVVDTRAGAIVFATYLLQRITKHAGERVSENSRLLRPIHRLDQDREAFRSAESFEVLEFRRKKFLVKAVLHN
jgi:hypothetical protein